MHARISRISSEGDLEVARWTASNISRSAANHHTLAANLIQQRPQQVAGSDRPTVTTSVDDAYTQSSVERYRIPLPGYAWVGTDEEPPPSYPNSSLATPIPGTSRTGTSTQSSNPPPNYTDCNIPPPTYEDLYETPESSSPKSTNIGSILRGMYLDWIAFGFDF